MKASFNLKIFNNKDMEGATCHLNGTVGNGVVTLQTHGPKPGQVMVLELSASELIIAAHRLSAGVDGLCEFPNNK